jgi:hypothetical protein
MALMLSMLSVQERRIFLQDLARLGQNVPLSDSYFAHRGMRILDTEKDGCFLWHLIRSDWGKRMGLDTVRFRNLDGLVAHAVKVDGRTIAYPMRLLANTEVASYLFNVGWHEQEHSYATNLKERFMFRIACVYKLGYDAFKNKRTQLADYCCLNAAILRDQIFPLLQQNNTIRLDHTSQIL